MNTLAQKVGQFKDVDRGSQEEDEHLLAAARRPATRAPSPKSKPPRSHGSVDKEVNHGTVLLAGGPADREPGFPLGLPRPLWPMVMRPLVLELIDRLVRGGAQAMSVCANGRTALYAARLSREPLGLGELCFVQDPLPRGPAGCLKDSEEFVGNQTFVAVNAACLFDDSLDSLVDRHSRQANHLTVFCDPYSSAPCGVYVCEPEILDHIPAVGYCDIKEQLIPRLIDRGLRVGALALHGAGGEVVDLKTYLAVYRHVLNSDLQEQVRSCPGCYEQIAPDVWVSSDALIGRRTRLFGPLIVGPGAKISDGAVVIGPSAVGPEAHIAEDAVVTECAWAKQSSRGVSASIGDSSFRTTAVSQPSPRRVARVHHPAPPLLGSGDYVRKQ